MAPLWVVIRVSHLVNHSPCRFHYGLTKFTIEEFEAAGIDSDYRALIGFMADQQSSHATDLTKLLGRKYTSMLLPRRVLYSSAVRSPRNEIFGLSIFLLLLEQPWLPNHANTSTHSPTFESLYIFVKSEVTFLLHCYLLLNMIKHSNLSGTECLIHSD